MRNSSAGLLEFDALKLLLGRYVASAMGRRELDRLCPSIDRAVTEAALEDVREAMDYLAAAARPHPVARGAAVRLRFDLPDVAAAVRRLFIEGACLEAAEIFELAGLLDRSSDIRGILTAAVERFPRLAARGAELGEFRPLLREIAGKVLPDGSISDGASMALARIRREIEKLKRQIQESLARFLHAHRTEGILQEEFITIRNERFVVPLIAGQQRKVEGVVHGSSGSGHTLFLEPFETVPLNNELVRLSEEEQREVHRILREITDKLRAAGPQIQKTLQALGELDLLFAKAQFALDFGAVIPRFSPSSAPRLILREARHPLLEDVLRKQKKSAVPLSLVLESDCRTLLISGPNTGGKTVVLKTAGLLALMAQSGLPVPAAEAEFPWFKQVLADIGDNQSIQESLSSFSAHMTRIREMMLDVTGDSLVLLDELGRATDPEEGGALGVAIVERFRAAGAFTLASTHLPALKIYAASTPGVLSGSMGFDDRTLQPTFVLTLGVPGKSAGLEIAARLGMPPHIIDRARAAMSSSGREMAQFLAELHRRLEDLDQIRFALEEERKTLAQRERELEKEWARREESKLRDVEARFEALAARFEQEAKDAIARIQEEGAKRKGAELALRKVARIRRAFEEQLHESLHGKERPISASPPANLIREGATVRVRDLRAPARVRRLLSDGRVEVEAGFVKVQVPQEDILEVIKDTGETQKLPRNVSLQTSPHWQILCREINVIGKRADEACEEVDKFLDHAALARVQRVRIIHGHGMGVLKKAIAELLSRNPHVGKYYPGTPAEGGTGATIVELRED